MSLTATDVARILADSRVLDAGQLEDLQPLIAQHRDGHSLTEQLVEWKWLTTYQAECVLTGHAPALLFGDYRLLEPIGQGGMGQVFRASHLRLNRVVALKIIRPQSLQATENPHELIRRFQREAQAVAQLLHPNIVILFDYNEISGTHFIAMEYVDGIDLAKMVQSQGPLPIPLTCDYVRQAASGLQHAFEFGMVHRDIKPSNLLVTKPLGVNTRVQRAAGTRHSGANAKPGDTPLPTRSHIGGILKILDMGLVRLSESVGDQDTLRALTMQGTIIGTPDFIAPEQARDASSVDIRADLYSLGCTFYFMLTGRPPFPTGTSVEKLFKHQNDQPMPLENIRPGTPPEVIGIVQRLMAKRAEGRFQTPAEVVDALTALPLELLTGRAKSDGFGKLVTAAAEVVQAERNHVHVEAPTQMFSPDSLILPARKLAVLQGHKGYVSALEFSPDGSLLASGGIDGSVRLWDVGMARPIERPLDQNDKLGEVHHVKFSPSGKTLYSGSTAMDGRHWRWDWNASNRNARSPFAGNEYRTSCFAVSPDGNHVAGGSASAVLIYDTNGSKRPTILKGHTGDVRCVAYSNSGKRLFSAGEDRTIRVWEPGRFWSSQRTTFEGHTDTISSIALTPDGSILASSSLDGTVRLWDASGESSEAVAVFTGHSHGVRHVRFTTNGILLLSVADAGQIFLWEVTESAKVREWQIQKSMMQCVATSSDCRYVAVGLNDGQVAFYDLELLVQQEQPAMQMAGV